MAKKKTVVEELQDEQAQDSAASLDGMEQGWSGPECTEGVAGGQSAPDFGQGEAAPPSDNFPPDDAPPFEEGEAGWQDDPPGMGDEPSANGSEDYNELLKEVGSATPIQDDPLVLSDEDAPPPEADISPALPQDDESGQNAARPERLRGQPQRVPPAARRSNAQVLTIDAHDHVQTEQEREDITWHEIRNAYRTRRIITGTLGGLEQTASGRTLAVVDYKGFRVAIPLKEMLFLPKQLPTNADYVVFMERQRRNLANMLGAEIDFVVKGIDSNARSIVASRKDAMLRKRQVFYMNTDELGAHMIYEGRIVQARVIAVAEKVVRVEAFGVECAIIARDLSWEWLGDAREHFSVGDRVLIRVLTIDRSGGAEDLSITADIRSVSSTTNLDNLKKCQVQCRYVGRVTDMRGGVVYIRLNNGVNAVAHACYDMRTPGKKDDVSFAVTRLDEEKGIAVGIITRIIKQNL